MRHGQFAALMDGFHTLETVDAFVLQGELRRILDTMADVHTRAAQVSLEDADLSVDRRAQLHTAAAHLRTARIACFCAWESGTLRHVLPLEYQLAVSKHSKLALVQATTYISLRDKPLVDKVLTEAEHVAAECSYFFSDERLSQDGFARYAALAPGTILNGVLRFFETSSGEYEREFFSRLPHQARKLRALAADM